MIIDLLSNFCSQPKSIIKQVLCDRAHLLEIEYNAWRNKHPNSPLLEYYTHSNFMIFSNAQDEIERDNDTDWDDMVQCINKNRFDCILDFGCGVGSAAWNLAKRVDVRAIHLYEPNLLAQQFLAKRFSGAYVCHSPDVVSAYKYDLIIAWGVFEHLDETQTLNIFQLMLKSLSSDGKIFMKNFYEQHDDYLLHFPKSEAVSDLFEMHHDKIIFAKNSH